MRRLPCLLPLLVLAACGGEAMTSRSPSAPQVLTGSSELVELENPTTRQELFREVARSSLARPTDIEVESLLERRGMTPLFA